MKRFFFLDCIMIIIIIIISLKQNVLKNISLIEMIVNRFWWFFYTNKNIIVIL